MLDLTRTPSRDAPLEAHEQYLRDFMTTMDDGLEAVRIVANGGAAKVEALDAYAQALEALRVGAVCDGRTRPTEEDVRNARHLVQLAREGAPSEALFEPARRAAERLDLDGRGAWWSRSSARCR